MSPEKYCGNCGWHNVYEYPDLIFCELKLTKLPTLTPACGSWTQGHGECFCVRDALENREKGRVESLSRPSDKGLSGGAGSAQRRFEGE